MSREIFLFRHFEDQQSVGNYRDGGIVEGYEPQMEEAIGGVIEKLKQDDYSSVLFIASPQQRVRESIDVLSSELHERTGVPTTIFEDDRLSAIHHGDYTDTTEESLDVAQRYAWDAYVDQVFVHENIYYRHGDPLVKPDGTLTYPELVGKFRSFGENQFEFTNRTYSFILDILGAYSDYHGRKEMVVVSSHMAPLMRLAEMTKLSQKAQPPLAMQLPQVGKLYLSEWNELASVQGDSELSKIMTPGGSCLLDLEQLHNLQPLIELEFSRQK